jgi:hypothetical protein
MSVALLRACPLELWRLARPSCALLSRVCGCCSLSSLTTFSFAAQEKKTEFKSAPSMDLR